jgi:hypothetical protein
MEDMRSELDLRSSINGAMYSFDLRRLMAYSLFEALDLSEYDSQ